MRDLIKRLVSEDSGATAIEYGLIAGLIAVVLIGALGLTGTSLESVFNSIAGELETVAGGAGGDAGGAGAGAGAGG